MRLRLKPGFRRVWRDPGTLQIGLSRRRGTVITGLIPQDALLVEALRHGIDPALPGVLSAYGDPERGQALVRVLGERGVLSVSGPSTPGPGRLGTGVGRLAPDAAVWSVVHPRSGDGWPLLAARADRRVVVRGAGRLGCTLSATLAAAGVGTVMVQDPGRITAADLAPAGAGQPDLGRLRQAVGQDVVRRAGGHPHPAPGAGSQRPFPNHPSFPTRPSSPSPSTRSAPGTRPGRPLAGEHPDLVVLIDHGTADATRADPLLSADVPHLAVVVTEDGAVVGPLVRPGRTPCLRCLDLHREDRDPGWAAVLSGSPPEAGIPAEETASSGLAAALAALQVLAQLDGLAEPAALGATLEIELPDGLIARRPWPTHPACGCH